MLVAPAGTPAAAAGRPYLDFGARLYDPRTAAWLAPDPLSEKYYQISPYAYCAGNPVNRIDHDGLYTYLLNYQYGTLTREGEEGEYDILYATNPANGGEVISIRINDRSLLGDLYQNNLNTDNSSVRTKNKAEVADLFMFLSKNSAVEWELAGINNGGMSYILMTSHDKNRVTSALIMRRQEEQNMVFSIHSHPTKGENDDQASGSWDSPSGDLGSARRIMNIQGTLDMNSKPYFFVYSVPRDELIRYTGENPHVSSRSIRGVKKPLDGIMKIQ